MPKESRPLGQKDALKVFQGVPVIDTFPTPNLKVSIDDILASQDDDGSAHESSTEKRTGDLHSAAGRDRKSVV